MGIGFHDFNALRGLGMESVPRKRRMLPGIGTVYLLLAWLSSRAGEYMPAIELSYVFPMIYGMLRLDRPRLAVLAAFALVTHGSALFMLVDSEHRLNQLSLWIQFAALALAFAWSTYAAGTMLRLRERLSEARRKLHDLGLAANERASRGALSGVYHHRHLMEALEREIARAERLGKPLSMAWVDLDWLGSINEVHGPAAGDIALQRFTAAAAGGCATSTSSAAKAARNSLSSCPTRILRAR